MLIKFAEWLPDQPPLNNPGALVVTNVIPNADSYLPFPGLNTAATNFAMGQIYGATYARDNANNTYVYMGDQTALYLLSGLSLTAATRTAGGAYNTDITNGWEFVNWGQTTIAVNGFEGDTPQQISFGAAHFQPVPGAMPASHIAVINNFVVLGAISDSATQVQRVRWSAINNSGLWSADATTLSDFQDLPGDGGWVQKIVGGQQGGYVFQERMIWGMQFVGSPLIFQFIPLVLNLGAYAAGSVVNYENVVYFLSNEGFKAFDGTNIYDIGKGKIDLTFFADLDSSYVGSIRGIIVPQSKIVVWAYPGSGHFGSKCNTLLVYSYAYQRWAKVLIPNAYSANIEIIAVTSTLGYTLDGLDAVSGSVDALAFSLDSRFWTGGALVMSAVVNGLFAYFNGDPLPAQIQTAETNLVAQQPMLPYQKPLDGIVKHKGMINEVWPIVENASLSTIQVTVLYRDTQQSVPSSVIVGYSNTSAGYATGRITARYHRFDIQTTGDFDSLQGVDVNVVNAGLR